MIVEWLNHAAPIDAKLTRYARYVGHWSINAATDAAFGHRRRHQIEHQECDRDGEDAVAERFHASGAQVEALARSGRIVGAQAASIFRNPLEER